MSDLAWLALSPDLAGSGGRYVDGSKEIRSSSSRYDVEKQEAV